MDKITREKVQAVCNKMHSAVWNIQNNIRGDGDGCGSAFPQQVAWEEFADALANLVSSDTEVQNEVRNLAMKGCPIGR